MTVACINLDKALPITEHQLVTMKNIKTWAHGIATAIGFTRSSPQVPANILDTLQQGPGEFKVNRCAINPITSAWAKAKYLKAVYELVVNIYDYETEEHHTLIIYLP